MEIPLFKISCISHRAALNDLKNDIRIPTIVAQTRARARGGVALATPSSAAAEIQMAKAKTNRAGRMRSFDSLVIRVHAAYRKRFLRGCEKEDVNFLSGDLY